MCQLCHRAHARLDERAQVRKALIVHVATVTLGQLVNGLVGKAIERVGVEPREVLHQCELLRLAGKKGIGESSQVRSDPSGRTQYWSVSEKPKVALVS